MRKPAIAACVAALLAVLTLGTVERAGAWCNTPGPALPPGPITPGGPTTTWSMSPGRPDVSWITGQVLSVDGGLATVRPKAGR